MRIDHSGWDLTGWARNDPLHSAIVDAYAALERRVAEFEDDNDGIGQVWCAHAVENTLRADPLLPTYTCLDCVWVGCVACAFAHSADHGNAWQRCCAAECESARGLKRVLFYASDSDAGTLWGFFGALCATCRVGVERAWRDEAS